MTIFLIKSLFFFSIFIPYYSLPKKITKRHKWYC